MNAADSASRLASLLDKIDQSKASQPREQSVAPLLPAGNAVNAVASTADSASNGNADTMETSKASVHASSCANASGWYEFLDGKSCKKYYHNYITGETQWDKPEADDIIVAPRPAPLSKPSDEVTVERAYFNKSAGRFSHSGSQSYWAKMGREEDKAGRQLGVFMDLSTLEANREEAKRMKEEAQRRSGSRGDVEWITYKEKKQNDKKRKAQSWLYED